MKFYLLAILLLSSCFNGEETRTQAKDSALQKVLDERSANSKENSPKEIQELFQKAIDDLIKTGIAKDALSSGDKVPDFHVNIQGNQIDIKDLIKEHNVIITFYRGGWCPYCMLQLEYYNQYLSDFSEKNAILIALSPDTPREVRNTLNRFDINFPLVSDKDQKIARKFGIVYTVDKRVLETYREFGIDLKTSQGSEKGDELPLSATYVINQDGIIDFTFLDADYTKRAEPSDILRALK